MESYGAVWKFDFMRPGNRAVHIGYALYQSAALNLCRPHDAKAFFRFNGGQKFERTVGVIVADPTDELYHRLWPTIFQRLPGKPHKQRVQTLNGVVVDAQYQCYLMCFGTPSSFVNF